MDSEEGDSDELDINSKRSVEIIAVASGKIPRSSFPKEPDTFAGLTYRVSIPEWSDESLPLRKERDDYLFFFVLSIEWKDGVAYRTGLGRMLRSAWDMMSTEEIDVVLG